MREQFRGSAAARGYGRRHEKWRKMVLARDALCRIEKLCGRGAKQSFAAPATVADHIIPLRAKWQQLTLQQRAKVMNSFPSTNHFLEMDPQDALKEYVWTMENGQGACAPCHNLKTRSEQGARPGAGI